MQIGLSQPEAFLCREKEIERASVNRKNKLRLPKRFSLASCYSLAGGPSMDCQGSSPSCPAGSACTSAKRGRRGRSSGSRDLRPGTTLQYAEKKEKTRDDWCNFSLGPFYFKESLGGSFSAVSTLLFASEQQYIQILEIFQDLQDL